MAFFAVGGPISPTSDEHFKNQTSDSCSTPQKTSLDRVSLKSKQFLKMAIFAVGGPISPTSDENFKNLTSDSSS